MDWAATIGVARVRRNDIPQAFAVSSRSWWFQSFKTKARQGVTAQQGVLVGGLQDRFSIRSLLSKYPGQAVDARIGGKVSDTVWEKNLAESRSGYDSSRNSEVIQQATIKELGEFMLKEWVAGAADDPDNPIRKEIQEFLDGAQ